MDVVIKELKIRNFRQIESKDYRFGDSVNRIIGKNGSGKSNTIHALSWVFFGTDYSSRSQFAIVPINPDGTVSEKEPAVEVTILTGVQSSRVKKHTLRRVLKDGSKTQTFIDGVPTKTLKEYNEFVARIFESQERFRMFSNPFYFTESLHWKEQRELFMRFFPLPTNAEVIEAIEAEVAFRGDSTAYIDIDLDKESDKLKHEQKELEKERDSIRAKIELLDDQLEGQHATDMTELKAERDSIQAELRDYHELVKKHSKQVEEVESLKRDISRQINQLTVEEQESASNAQRDYRAKIQDIELLLKKREFTRENYAEQYRKIKGEFSDKCKTCGQLIPIAEYNEIKDKTNKQLMGIVEKGKEVAFEIEKLRTLLEEAKAEKIEVVDHSEKIAQLRERLGSIEDVEPIESFDDAKQSRLYELDRIIANADVYDRSGKQRKEFKDRETEISRRFEAIEMKLLDISDMYQKRSELLVAKVNRAFKTISVKVVDIQKNGQARETFEILKDGIPYRELNTAGQLEASLELTSFLKSKLGVKCPLLIDNGERYTDVAFDRVTDQMIIAVAVKGKELELVKK